MGIIIGTGSLLNVLSLEDSIPDFEMICHQLTHAGYNLNITHVDKESDFTESILSNQYEIILADFNLPGFDAFGALRLCNEICPTVPFICVSGSIGEDTAIELLKLGAVDYVIKDRPEKLPLAVKRALEEAKEKESHRMAQNELLKLSSAVEQSPASVIITNPQGEIEYVNKKFIELTGFSKEEVIGNNPRILQSGHQDVFFYKEFWKTILSGKEWNGELVNRKKNGELYCESARIFPLFNHIGAITNFVAVKEDITEKKKILEELISAKEKAEESDKLKTAFINNISHEIRTPLNGILGFGELLADNDLTQDERMQYYAILKKSSDRLMNTVTDYMDMARIVSGNMALSKNEFPLQPVFTEIIERAEQLCAEKKIDFVAVIPTRPVDIILCSSREFIRKAINILLDNALKFTRQGSIRCGYRIIPGFLEFFVQDTGIGIANNKQEMIFNIFSQEDSSLTRGYEGSGLGLSIAHGLVKLLGGTINLTSGIGIGSTFAFTIPYIETTITGKQATAKTLESTITSEPLVLIAEDEESNYLYMEVVMKMIDCNYILALDGAEAVEMCRKNPKITMVLMDIKMPVMNGLEATKLIHEFRPEIPIIAITAYAQTGDENRLLAAGCDGYLSKPIKKENLLSLLQKYT